MMTGESSGKPQRKLENMISEAKLRANNYGKVVGIASRVSPISHGENNKEVEVEIPFENYLESRLIVDSFLGLSLLIPGTLILGRIKEVSREDLMSLSRVPALSVNEDPSSVATPLRIKVELISELIDENGVKEVVPPSSPIDPQSPVFLPNDDFVKTMLGLPIDGIEIGKVVEGYRRRENVEARISKEMLSHHILVIGTTGSGKTNLLKTIYSKSDIPLIAFDIQGDYIRTAIREGGRIVIPMSEDYAKMGIVPFLKLVFGRSSVDINIERDLVNVDGQTLTFSSGEKKFKVTLMGFKFSKVAKDLADISTLFSPQGAYFFKLIIDNAIVDNISNWETIEKEGKDNLHVNIHQYTLSNIERAVKIIQEMRILDLKIKLSDPGMTLQHKSIELDEPSYEELLKEKITVDLRWIMERGIDASVTAAYIIMNRIFKLKDNAYKQGKEILPYIMMFDEAHEYFPQSRKNEEGKESLERLINKIMRLGRVRGIGTILATHRPEDLNDLIITLTNSKVALRADNDALRRVDMEEYSKILEVSPPGFGIIRTFAYRAHNVFLRSDKFD
ncbi:ATP-binding protein [Candidatus Acidianus copahuensis]|nr:ATP-binding protein [Candidatus Acidianus copahuensis]